MKRILLAFFLLTASLTPAHAQKVFAEIRDKAKSIAENPNANELIRKVNQFKVDELNYMVMKMKEEMPDSSTIFLDKQAFAMNQFVNTYLQKLVDLSSQPKVLQVKLTRLFMDASYSNPLFHDSDKELVLTYYNDAESIIRFSLDTDWRRANVAILMHLPEFD